MRRRNRTRRNRELRNRTRRIRTSGELEGTRIRPGPKKEALVPQPRLRRQREKAQASVSWDASRPRPAT